MRRRLRASMVRHSRRSVMAWSSSASSASARSGTGTSSACASLASAGKSSATAAGGVSALQRCRFWRGCCGGWASGGGDAGLAAVRAGQLGRWGLDLHVQPSARGLRTRLGPFAFFFWKFHMLPRKQAAMRFSARSVNPWRSSKQVLHLSHLASIYRRARCSLRHNARRPNLRSAVGAALPHYRRSAGGIGILYYTLLVRARPCALLASWRP